MREYNHSASIMRTMMISLAGISLRSVGFGTRVLFKQTTELSVVTLGWCSVSFKVSLKSVKVLLMTSATVAAADDVTAAANDVSVVVSVASVEEMLSLLVRLMISTCPYVRP